MTTATGMKYDPVADRYRPTRTRLTRRGMRLVFAAVFAAGALILVVVPNAGPGENQGLVSASRVAATQVQDGTAENQLLATAQDTGPNGYGRSLPVRAVSASCTNAPNVRCVLYSATGQIVASATGTENASGTWGFVLR